MALQLDRDTRILVVIGILIAQVVLIFSLLMYFRKKENDTLLTLFQMQERINQLEMAVNKKNPPKTEPELAP